MKRSSFNNDWEFARDDEAFEPVVVPHDAMLGNRRSADAPAGSASGYYHGARYRYHKVFELDEHDAAGCVMLEFEGVYRDARISVNGLPVDAPPYGFVPFFVDLTGIVRTGENTIEVEASNAEQPDCRWYSGGGLYRPVWIWTGETAHIEPEGVRVTTLSIDPPTIRVNVEAAGGTPEVRVVDDAGNAVAQGRGTELVFELPDAELWSADNPALYQLNVDLLDEGEATLDRTSTTFGIRMLEWSPRGLFVNGRETLLRGGCIHCDNGILGAASWRESEWRRIRLLKQAGFNAVRVAHNPAPAALLEACDVLGMYIMDEAWDMWFMRKNAHDYARHFLDWCDHDLRRLIAHDYNHPSVIMYSIGNEIADPITDEGVAIEQALVSLVHALDSTRPVTCGFNLTMMVMERRGNGWYAQHDGDDEASLVSNESDPPRASLLFNLTAQALGTGMTYLARTPGADALVSPALDALDIAGYNYAASRYAVDARKHPDRIVVGSETFPHKLAQNWTLVESMPNVIGDFMWAAWDYLGEAGAGAWAYTAEEAGFSKPWPWLIAGSGALDILGRPNAAAALAGAVWHTADGPSIQVRPVNIMSGKTYKATWRGSDAIPSWSWRGCEGVETQVEVYDGHAHSIALELNGAVVGTTRVRNCVARFKVVYEPGILTAKAFDENGTQIGQASLKSATGNLHLRMQAEKPSNELDWSGDGYIAYVSVDIVGDNDEVESNADERISVKVDGGTLLAFGSARPATTESFLEGAYTTYRGQALAVVYRDEPGMATITASGQTLESVTTTLAF